MSTFNNGLYTPFDATSTALATPIVDTDTVNSQTLSILTVASSTFSESSIEATTIASTTIQATSSSTKSSPLSTSTSRASPTPTTFSSKIPTTSSISSTSTSSLPAPTIDSATTADPNSIKQLTPLFVLAPIILFAIIGGITYGKYWGAGGKAWRAKRRNKNWGISEEDEDEEGLVKSRFVDENGNIQEKGSVAWMGNNSLARERSSGIIGKTFAFLSRNSFAEGDHEHGTYEVPYSNGETPFIRPSTSNGEIIRKAYLTSSAEEHEQEDIERGWSWGANVSSLTEIPRRSLEDRKPLSPGWKWAAKRYRAKEEGSRSSRTSETSFGTLGSMIRGVRKKDFMPIRVDEEQRDDGSPPSPSVYSPRVEESNDNDLDRFLGESRVGNDEFHNRFLTGNMTTAETHSFSQAHSQTRRATQPKMEPVAIESDYQGFRMEVELPSAPSRSHVSPKKAIVRGLNPITPIKNQNQLLFAYNSPQDSPVRSRPPRDAYSPSGSRVVGVPMPAFEIGQVRGSESTLSLNNGIRAMIFGEETKRRESANLPRPNLPRESSNLPQPKLLRQSTEISLEEVKAIVMDRSIAQHSRNLSSIPASPAMVEPEIPKATVQTLPRGRPKLPLLPANSLPLSPPLAPFSPPLPPSPNQKVSRVRAAIEELEIRVASPGSASATRTGSNNAADAVGHREELEQASIAILLKKRSKLSIHTIEEIAAQEAELAIRAEIKPLNLTRRTISTLPSSKPTIIRSTSTKSTPASPPSLNQSTKEPKRPKSSSELNSTRNPNAKSKPGAAGITRPTSLLISNTLANRTISPAQGTNFESPSRRIHGKNSSVDEGKGSGSEGGWEAMLRKTTKE